MSTDRFRDPDLRAAAAALGEARRGMGAAPSFGALREVRQASLSRDLDRIRRALESAPRAMSADPYAADALARGMAGPFDPRPSARAPVPAEASPPESEEGGEPRQILRAVSQLPAAAGAAADELNFSAFVASLVHGVFDAIVDSSIRQMEAFGDLVASLAQDVDAFAQSNVTRNQVRDWLHERHPNDLVLELPETPDAQPRLLPRLEEDAFGGFEPSPPWLADYGLENESLSEELIERRLIPAARRRIGQDRMRTLATMVLMGINRVKVDRGEISARIRIRAAAADRASVDFATSQDSAAAQSGWGGRTGFMSPAAQPTAMVSTSVNAQAEGQIAAELLGEVRLSFSSETLPLERFADEAARVLLERAARRGPARSQRAARPVEEAEVLAPPAEEAAEAPPPAAAGEGAP